MRSLVVGFCCLIVSTNVTSAQDAAALAKSAQAVLKDRCFSCHGESGANEGGFNYALNRKRMVRELIVPGSSNDSKLFQRVVKGEMPPDGDKLPQDEIDTLKKWIEADAPAFGAETKREFVSPTDMLSAMLKDLEKANDRDRPFYRYFTLTHLYNAGFEDNELESHRQGLSKLVNSLSWGREVRVPVAIDSAKTILRIDLRHYKWNENEAWSRIVAADPYRVTYTHAAAQTCYLLTKSELPHARADWFVFAASRPPLYNLILGLPDKPDEMLKFEKERLGVDVARNLQDYNGVLRAGFFPSGVSKSIRLIERHGSSYGAYWKSYDFKPVDPKEQPPKRRNLKANPTGPGGPLGFEHDGGEMIFNLPNGLQAYMLTDAAGQQIAKGPTDVVVDKEAVKRGRDPEVVNGVSCMNCHWSGMLNKTDQIREHVLSQPAAYSKEVIEFVTAVYAPKADLNAKLTEDRQRFEAAVRQCGLTGLAKSEPVATLAFQFDEPLDLDLAAAEAGVTPDKLVAALRSNTVLGRELGSLPQGQPVPRDTFLQVFGAVVKELKVGTFLAALSIRGSTPNTPLSAGKRTNLITLIQRDTLDGWETTTPDDNGNWTVKNDVLTNIAKGPSLVTRDKFNNFDLDLEFSLPRGCNSGVFLRGRYEVQLHDPSINPEGPLGVCGAIFGTIAPSRQVYVGPDKWNSLHVRLVNRTVSVQMNGQTIIDGKPIDKVSKVALDDRELDPGPIMLQSADVSPLVTVGAKFRNITIKVLPSIAEAKPLDGGAKTVPTRPSSSATAKEIASKSIVGEFDVAWQDTETGQRGVSKYIFKTNNDVVKETRRIGTWESQGNAIVLSFLEAERGKVQIKFTDLNTFTGSHTWSNGKVAKWTAKRSK